MLRIEEIIHIGDEAVTVRELSVAQLPAAAGILGALLSIQGIGDVPAFLETNADATILLLVGATSLGENIRETGGAALCEILEAFVRVNTVFFARARSLPGVLAADRKTENPGP